MAEPLRASSPGSGYRADGQARELEMPQKLLVYQSLWAMERRRPDGMEWSLSEKLAMILDAGFDGAGVRFVDAEYARQVTGFLRAHGMSWQAQCYPRSVE